MILCSRGWYRKLGLPFPFWPWEWRTCLCVLNLSKDLLGHAPVYPQVPSPPSLSFSTSLPNNDLHLMAPFSLTLSSHCNQDSAGSALLKWLSTVTSGFYIATRNGYFKVFTSFEPSAAFDTAAHLFLLGTFFSWLPRFHRCVSPDSVNNSPGLCSTSMSLFHAALFPALLILHLP